MSVFLTSNAHSSPRGVRLAYDRSVTFHVIGGVTLQPTHPSFTPAPSTLVCFMFKILKKKTQSDRWSQRSSATIQKLLRCGGMVMNVVVCQARGATAQGERQWQIRGELEIRLIVAVKAGMMSPLGYPCV